MEFNKKNESFIGKMGLNWTVLIFLLFISEISCNSIGYIYPRHNIIQKAHDDIELYCILKESNETSNSRFLSFFKNDSKYQQEQITIVNDTTIRLNLRDVSPMNDVITCMRNVSTGVDMKVITIGTPPTKVEDFGCLAYDFIYFECQFTIPENFVEPNYTLSYMVQTSLYNCELERLGNKYICNMTLPSQRYRQVHDIYNFILRSENMLGPERVDNYKISHFSSVIPGKPSINITNITTNSAILDWKVLKTMYEKTGIVYDIRRVSQYNEGNWTTLRKNSNLYSIRDHIIHDSYKLNDLHPYTWYEIELKLKVAKARDSPEMWTKTNITFQTLSNKPNTPPKVDIGSFHQSHYNSSTKLCTIYWRGLPQNESNGPGLKYIIKEVKMNQKIIDIDYSEKTDYSAKYVLEKADYEFTIHTANEKGESTVGSVIRVPNKDYPGPQQIKKILKDKSYIIKWRESELNYDSNLKLRDYTIFKCYAKSETFDQCKNDFDFIHVNKNVSSAQFENDEKMNFAIAANYYNSSGVYSSGMVWARCTAFESSDFSMITPKGLPQNGTTIKLEWSLECVASTVVEGFRLSYCPITINTTCKTAKENITIDGVMREYYLNNLKPYTTYRIWMSMFSKTKEGPSSSNPLELTTLESSPTVPRRLTVLNKTDHSIGLQWNAPESINGILRYYTISYNNENVVIEVNQLANQSAPEANLEHLSSYTTYKIYVTASTTQESDASNDCTVQTKIGIPGTPKTSYNSSFNAVTWRPPVVPSGPINYYEFQTKIYEDDNYIGSRISRVNGLQCTMQALRDDFCQKFPQKHSHRFEFHVRAVNVDEINSENIKESSISENSKDELSISDISFQCDEENIELNNWLKANKKTKAHLKSQWTTPFVVRCALGGSNNSHIITIIASLFSFGAFSIIIYLLSQKYVQMKDISIAFPPGLTDLDQESRPKGGCDNIITTDDMAQCDESIYKNENHHLLANNRINSQYLTDLTDNKSDTIDFDHNPVAVNRDDEECSSEHADSVEMSDMSDSSNNSPTDSPNISREMPMQSAKPFMNPIIINGYVQHQSFLPKPPSSPLSYEYTKMDTPDNSIIPTNENESSKQKDPTSINSGTHENICGYVTHKQLSAFGHLQQ